jgi:hypothetical protein
MHRWEILIQFRKTEVPPGRNFGIRGFVAGELGFRGTEVCTVQTSEGKVKDFVLEEKTQIRNCDGRSFGGIK